MKQAQAQDALGELSDNVEILIDKIRNVDAPGVSALKDRVSRKMERTRLAIADVRGQAEESLRRAAWATDDYVRESPWIAVGIAAGLAAGVGFLAGWLASRDE